MMHIIQNRSASDNTGKNTGGELNRVDLKIVKMPKRECIRDFINVYILFL